MTLLTYPLLLSQASLVAKLAGAVPKVIPKLVVLQPGWGQIALFLATPLLASLDFAARSTWVSLGTVTTFGQVLTFLPNRAVLGASLASTLLLLLSLTSFTSFGERAMTSRQWPLGLLSETSYPYAELRSVHERHVRPGGKFTGGSIVVLDFSLEFSGGRTWSSRWNADGSSTERKIAALYLLPIKAPDLPEP